METDNVLAQAQDAGIELGPELSDELQLQTVQSTIQDPVAKEPIVVLTDTEQKLQSLTQEVPKGETKDKDKSKDTDKADDDLAWLDIPEDLGVENLKEPLAIPDTPEAQKFAEDFKQYLGFDVNELREGISSFSEMQKEINQYRAQKKVDSELKTLKGDWGVDGTDFDSRMAQVVERFNKYSPEMKAKLDGTEGAKLIWAKIEQEQVVNNRKPQVPQFERSRSTGATGLPRPQFTQRDIDSMDSATYERNADAILHAYANGLIQK